MYHITVFHNSHVVTVTALCHRWQQTTRTECNRYMTSDFTKFNTVLLHGLHRKNFRENATAVSWQWKRYCKNTVSILQRNKTHSVQLQTQPHTCCISWCISHKTVVQEDAVSNSRLQPWCHHLANCTNRLRFWPICSIMSNVTSSTKWKYTMYGTAVPLPQVTLTENKPRTGLMIGSS